MRFSLEIGDREKTRIDFARSRWWGAMTIRANGQVVASRSPLDPSTHFSFKLAKIYEFDVGDTEPHVVVIEHKRPLLFAGLRRHTYRVYVDEQLVAEHFGY